MEREIVFTGIGGQGIQLMAKILAQAAAADGRHAMLFGVYGGMMRGGASESTLVLGDDPIEAPPIISQCWSVVAMHPSGLAALAPKLRADGRLFLNQTLVLDNPRPDVSVVRIPATRVAEQAGNTVGAAMVMLGAFIAATRILDLAAVIDAMRASLPPHRQSLGDLNARLLQLGAECVSGGDARTIAESKAAAG